MYGYIYQTTNTKNGKKYIGQHQGATIDENYLGSGAALRRAIRKYGREAFTVEILEVCHSKEELNQREFDIIDVLNAVESHEYYNIMPGGNCPPQGNRGNKEFRHSLQSRARISAGIKKRYFEKRQKGLSYFSDEGRARKRKKLDQYWTLEKRKERAETARQRRLGCTNDRWINLEEMLETMTQSEIADALGVDQSAVAQRIRDYNINASRSSRYYEKVQSKREAAAKLAHEARRRKEQEKWEGHDLAALYETMTQAEIARIVGVSQVAVSRKLRLMGISKKPG